MTCQTLCAETAHCIGYTFVKVTLNVGVLVVALFIVVAVVRVSEVAQKQKGPSPKSLDLDENFKSNLRYFVAILRIVAIYAHVRRLWAKIALLHGIHSY